jgi:LmbE family N-acetylglucosaminyl deacetylase
MLVVFSPHLDDGVFSCAALIAKHQTRVISICAGIPTEEVPPGDFDVMAGFRTAADAIRQRRVEDVQAGAILGCEMIHMDCVEDQYDRGMPGRAGRVRKTVATALQSVTPGDILLAPLGLRHPDHELVRSAFCDLVAGADCAAWMYEELPYRALWPEHVRPAIEASGSDATTQYFTHLAPAIKHRALRCYMTQLVGMDTQPLLLPECYHRLKGKADLW